MILDNGKQFVENNLFISYIPMKFLNTSQFA